jgi:TPR repeat protein
MDKELQQLIEAAESENPDAMTVYASLLLGGEDIEQDITKGLKYLRGAAEKGFADAQYFLGCFYAEGTFVLKDEQKGISLLRLASEQGHPDAINDLGYAYLHGIGVNEDQFKAFQYFERAYELGSQNAESNLALCYFSGMGCVQDSYKVAQYSKRGAENGLAQSQRLYAVCLLGGQGVQKDEHKALQLLYKAADQGDSGAEFFIAMHYIEKGDQLKGQEYLERSAKHGNSFASTTLAALKAENSNSSNCYIATATFGSPNASEVVFFRQFRDLFLLNSKSGRMFVNLYYKISPYLAKIVKKSAFTKSISFHILLKIKTVLQKKYNI